MNKDEKNPAQQGPQGKEVSIDVTTKPSSELESGIIDDIKKDQSINIDVIMDMAIKEFENNKTLQSKCSEDLKKLRQQWTEFSTLFQTISKNID